MTTKVTDIQLTPSQERAFQSFKNGANLFLTGKGGSGKSFLVEHIKGWCSSRGYDVVTCAFMGIAALNVGGSTIHRLFKPGNGIISRRNKKCTNPKALEILKKVDVFIIDEISTVRADLFAYVANTILDIWKQQTSDKRKQIIVVGDFYQLPPFIIPAEKEAYNAVWENMLYAFETPQWKMLHLQTIELQESMRQTDKGYIHALDDIREGIPNLSVFRSTATSDSTAVTLCGRNDEVNNINTRMLNALPSRKYRYISTVKGEPQPSDFPTDKELVLAVGARVIMITNDPDGRWVNGSLATVTSLGDSYINVRLDDGNTISTGRAEWKIEEYTIEEGKDKKEVKLVKSVKAIIRQFPVRLAWAISIHKSQGQTYDRVNVNVKSIFQCGMLYVALSRCRTLAGMRIVGDLTARKVMVDRKVIRFMSERFEAPRQNSIAIPFEE